MFLGDQKKVINSLEPELQLVLSLHVGVGDQNRSSGIAVRLVTAEPSLQSQGKVLSGPVDSGIVFELVLTLWRD